MASLLTTILTSPNPPPDLSSPHPPPGYSSAVWGLRHELPLHLINYLRDQTEPLLSLSSGQVSGTPGKGGVVSSRYQYSSPLKTVVESPTKNRPDGKKPKKKVKLFSSKVGSKGNKSFGDVEDTLTSQTVRLEGIDTLPLTPIRQNEQARNKLNQTFSGRFTENENRKKKTAPSPVSFSLGDFLTPVEGRKGGKKKGNKGSKSPSKVKSSTPVEENSATSRMVNLNCRLGKLDLDSPESFPEIGEENFKKRRIKPIQLTCQNSNNPIFGQIVERSTTSSSSPFKVAEVERQSVDDRQMVKESITKTTPFKSVVTPLKTPAKTPIITRTNSISSQLTVTPNPLMVSNQGHLVKLSQLYSYVLSNNLMPNLIVEIYFLLELLLIEAPDQEQDTLHDLSAANNSLNSENFFETVHNCVFFSTSVIRDILILFKHFDRSSLKLLQENSRLLDFCGVSWTEESQLTAVPTVSPNKSTVICGGRLQNVSFQSETDNRSNFPSSASFHDFKKQRDKFYSLVRQWGDLSKGADYNFSTQLSGEVDLVMAMHSHPVNYAHFARLFSQQLVAMCRGEGTPEQTDQQDDQLSDLRRTDPVKYKRLAARLVTPGRCGGPCPAPSFSGSAEFFRDFVVHCKSAQFVAHLLDCIVCEILRLDHMVLDEGGEMWGSGVSRLDESNIGDISGGPSNDLLVEQFQETVVTLRILGKFLGFLLSFPYQMSELLSEDLLVSAQLLRCNSPPLDLLSCVKSAESKGRLVVTIPWVVECLSQLDQVTASLPIYRSLHLRLAVIYQTRLTPFSTCCSPLNAHFLTLCLGWLFETKTFHRESLILARIETNLDPSSEIDQQIDHVDVVTSGLVIQCCPWVQEVRTVLQQWETRRETSRRGSQLSLDRLMGDGIKNYRKITPVSAPVEPKPKQDTLSLLQTQLEESFFHNQPKSIRRTVEFLSERLASNIIKQIRVEIVPAEIDKVATDLKQKSDGSNILSEIASDSLARVIEKVTTLLTTIVRTDCSSALSLLLSSDTSQPINDTCESIASRMVGDKVWQWVGQHVTLTYFTREFNTEIEKQARLQVKEATIIGNKINLLEHDPEGIPPSHLLIQMKDQLKILLLNKSSKSHLNHLSSSDLLRIIEDVKLCLTSRADLTPLAVKGLETLSLDWTLGMLVVFPELITRVVVDKLVSLWEVLTPPHLVTILCARNVILLEQASDIDATSSSLQLLLIALVESGLLPCLALEDSWITLQQSDIDLDHVQHCLVEVANNLGESEMRSEMSWVYNIQKVK